VTDASRNRIAYFSLAGSVFVLLLKFVAYVLTGSAALLSDAAESIVNVIAAVIVLIAMRIALRPADYQHPYGHGKAEVVSSALEGGMILVAAGMILLLPPGAGVSPVAFTSGGLRAICGGGYFCRTRLECLQSP
jgi:divalent metal cation (Fe/Co/Zn/Cd) transporter